MHISPTRWYILLGCALILLVAAGCYQQAGNADFSTPVARDLPTETPLPTDTEPPPPPTETPSPTEDLATFGQGGVFETSTFETPTQAPLEVAQAQDILGIEAGETATTEFLLSIDPLYVTATAFILQATQTVSARQTIEAGGALTPFVTSTPPPPLGITNTPIPQPQLPGTDCVHEVSIGENLYRISLRYGTTVRDIANANGIVNINLIVVGQKLTIPGCGTLGVTPPPTTIPDTGTGVGTTTAPGTGGGRIHVVEQGQTLFEISLIYGVPVNTIAAANGIANINLIYLNQELVIP
jgi:LysM repeat protein